MSQQCKCGSYAINDDPAKVLCDCCWRSAEIMRWKIWGTKAHTLLGRALDGVDEGEFVAGQWRLELPEEWVEEAEQLVSEVI